MGVNSLPSLEDKSESMVVSLVIAGLASPSVKLTLLSSLIMMDDFFWNHILFLWRTFHRHCFPPALSYSGTAFTETGELSLVKVPIFVQARDVSPMITAAEVEVHALEQ